LAVEVPCVRTEVLGGILVGVMVEARGRPPKRPPKRPPGRLPLIPQTAGSGRFAPEPVPRRTRRTLNRVRRGRLYPSGPHREDHTFWGNDHAGSRGGLIIVGREREVGSDLRKRAFAAVDVIDTNGLSRTPCGPFADSHDLEPAASLARDCRDVI
jgi:hypothetical protein